MSIVNIIQLCFGKKEKTTPRNLVSNLTLEEQTKIFDSLADDKSKRITIKDYYSHFGIDIDKSMIVDLLKSAENELYFKSCLIKLFPELKSKRLKTLFNDTIPNQLVQITQDRIDRKNKGLLESYIDMYNNPQEDPKTLKSYVREIKHAVYDFGIFVTSFGSRIVVRPTHEELWKESITQSYQLVRKEYKEQTKEIVEAVIMNYFKIEARFRILDDMMKTNAKIFAQNIINDNNLIYNKPLINNSLKYNNLTYSSG